MLSAPTVPHPPTGVDQTILYNPILHSLVVCPAFVHAKYIWPIKKTRPIASAPTVSGLFFLRGHSDYIWDSVSSVPADLPFVQPKYSNPSTITEPLAI